MRGKLAQSSLRTMVVLGLRVVTQAIVLVLLTRLLDPGQFGNFSAAIALAVVLGLLPGFGAGYVMLARNAEHHSGAAEVWQYAWPTTVFIGLLLLPLYVLSGSHITSPSLGIATLVFLGLSELLFTPIILLLSFVLQARERVPLSQVLLWLPLGLRILAVTPCFLLQQEQRLAAYAAFQTAGSVAALCMALAVVAKSFRLEWTPRWPTRHELKQGGSYAAMHVISANPSELDKMIAVHAVGAHDAGIYAATSRAMAATVVPVIALLLSSQPRLFRYARHPSPEGGGLIQLIAAIALGWGILAGTLLALFSPLLHWLFGQAFAEASDLMPLLAVGAPFLSLRLAAGTILASVGKPLERIVLELCGMVVLVSAILLLAPESGTEGIAIAFILSEATMAAAGWAAALRRWR